MCFSPQRRAIFQHLNFKKWSGADVFCIFSLENVRLATAVCNFWFLLWPHDSAPAALTSLLFDSPDTRIIGKTQHFATSLTFGAGESSFFWLSRYCIFFLLTLLHLLTLLSCDLTSSICFSSAFQLSILSEVYYLNFLRLKSAIIRIPSWTQLSISWLMSLQAFERYSNGPVMDFMVHVRVECCRCSPRGFFWIQPLSKRVVEENAAVCCGYSKWPRKFFFPPLGFTKICREAWQTAERRQAGGLCPLEFQEPTETDGRPQQKRVLCWSFVWLEIHIKRWIVSILVSCGTVFNGKLYPKNQETQRFVLNCWTWIGRWFDYQKTIILSSCHASEFWSSSLGLENIPPWFHKGFISYMCEFSKGFMGDLPYGRGWWSTQ